MMRTQDFMAHVLIVDKMSLDSIQLKSRENIYSLLVRVVLQNNGGLIRDATLILGESFKSNKSKQLLATYLQ